MKSILVADNQLSHRNILDKFLLKNNYRVETSSSGAQSLDMMRAHNYDVVLSEYRLPDMDGSDFFDRSQTVLPSANFIFMTRDVNLKVAIDLIRRGAYQYLAKPLNPDELLAILDACESPRPSLAENSTTSTLLSNSASTEPSPNIIYGKSAKAKWMIRQAEKVAATNFSVLIEGETGTGKESLARMIHEKSNRNKGPFIAVDCGSLSREIAGSELFGHEKGSFTGALNSKTGFFEQADGGTIFLDEIANLSMDIQISLLRALQEKVIRKIGGAKEIPVDVRIIAATNEELHGKSQSAGFREDLLFRLNEFVLKVPTLRERKEDLPLFVDFFLDQTCKELCQEKPTLADGVMEYLHEYKWPGNIRELRNVIRRGCLFVNRHNEITVESLPHRLLYGRTKSSSEESTGAIITQANLNSEDTDDLKSTAIRAESLRIIEVLKEVHFNKTRAAEVLNIHRKTLYSKLKLMNIPF